MDKTTLNISKEVCYSYHEDAPSLWRLLCVRNRCRFLLINKKTFWLKVMLAGRYCEKSISAWLPCWMQRRCYSSFSVSGVEYLFLLRWSKQQLLSQINEPYNQLPMEGSNAFVYEKMWDEQKLFYGCFCSNIFLSKTHKHCFYIR